MTSRSTLLLETTGKCCYYYHVTTIAEGLLSPMACNTVQQHSSCSPLLNYIVLSNVELLMTASCFDDLTLVAVACFTHCWYNIPDVIVVLVLLCALLTAARHPKLKAQYT
jgi:hypothetical protein